MCKRSNQQRLLRERNFRPSLDWAAVSKLAISAQGLRKGTPTTSGASQSLAHLVTLGFCLGLVEAILIRLTHSGSDLCYDVAGWLTLFTGSQVRRTQPGRAVFCTENPSHRRKFLSQTFRCLLLLCQDPSFFILQRHLLADSSSSLFNSVQAVTPELDILIFYITTISEQF